MFGLFSKKSKLYGSKFQHITSRGDWDVMNRQIFGEVVEKWNNGIALLTNNYGGQSNLPKPNVRIQPDLHDGVKQLIQALSNEQFNKIYHLARNAKPNNTDCYVIRNLGLPNNALVYLIEHTNHINRTMVVFGGERMRGKLEEKLSLVSKLLTSKGKAKSAIKHERAAPAETANPADTNYGNNFAMKSATDKQLVRREEFLEALGNLDYSKRVELEKIRAELMQRSHRRA